MVDPAVARVLSQLQQVEALMLDLEHATGEELAELRAAPVGPRVVDAQAVRQREQFLLGQIEGLTRAQLIVLRKRTSYGALHGMIRYPGRGPDQSPAAGPVCAYCGLPITIRESVGVVHAGTGRVSCDPTAEV